MKLEKYSFGIGDRFGKQGKSQLSAVIRAKEQGIHVVPVWNKSFREHEIIGTRPDQVREEADQAVQTLGWKGSYHVDADHVALKTVSSFLKGSDFYTLDVADFIGKSAEKNDMDAFMDKAKQYAGEIILPILDQEISVSEADIYEIAEKYLYAVKEAGRLYRHILERKGADSFITEVSMDETDLPQTPVELYFILFMISLEKIPAQTIAPKFSGRFNKGVDYVGDTGQFHEEFEQDVSVIDLARKTFSLPDNIKLSVHSGSDKFSIYAAIRDTLKKFNAGVHVKTAGTTWLEELIGLAEADGEGLEIAIDIYCQSYEQKEALCKPYATVIDIQDNMLPDPKEVKSWGSEEYTSALRHNPENKRYNPHFRQLLHVGYKVAAKMGERYLNALDKYEDIVSKNVIENILERHIKSIFPTE